MADRPELPTFEGDEPNFGTNLYSWLDASIDATGGAIKAAAPIRLFDAKGDLMVGTAADTASRLAVGSNGQVLKANSATSTGLEWAAEAGGGSGIPASTVDAKGDLIVGTANDTVDNLAVGTNGYVLKANSATATGLQWAAESGGGGSSAEGIKYIKADYGAIMDGSSHTIASVYTTVAAAKLANPTWAAVDDAPATALLTTDQCDWAALQAAFYDLEAWSKLMIDAGTAMINKELHFPVTMPLDTPTHIAALGKVIEGVSREESIIEQMTDNTRIIKDDCSDLKHSTVMRNFWLRYTNQQTNASHPNSIGIALYNDASAGGFGGPGNRYWSRWEQIRISGATEGIATAGSVGAFPWGCQFDDILMNQIAHTAVRLTPTSGGGIPTVTFTNIQVHEDPVTPTGACFNIVATNAIFINPDVEGWLEWVFYHQGGSDCTVIGGNIEHWLHTTDYSGVVFEANGVFNWIGGGVASDAHTNYSRMFLVASGGTLHVSDFTLIHNNWVSGPSDFVIVNDSTSKAYLENIRFQPGNGGSHGNQSAFPCQASEATTRSYVQTVNEWRRPPVSPAAGTTGAALATGGTIATSVTVAGNVTAWLEVTRVAPAATVTGAILAAGQGTIRVVNESANLITFAAEATSLVLGGTAVTVPAGMSRAFDWHGTRWVPQAI